MVMLTINENLIKLSKSKDQINKPKPCLEEAKCINKKTTSKTKAAPQKRTNTQQTDKKEQQQEETRARGFWTQEGH